MSDPRVVRGTTFQSSGGAPGSKTKKDLMSRTTGSINAGRSSKRATSPKSGGRRGSGATTTPSANAPVKDILEELTDRAIEVDDQEVNVKSAIMERPASPLFVPATVSKDAETQVLDGDLFNFDIEVEPLLEVLVGRTLFVAVEELKQEDEIADIRRRQLEFEGIRNVELAEVQRLEMEERRREDERIRREEQIVKRQEERNAVQHSIAAKKFAHEYLGGLTDNLFETLDREGHFADPVHAEILQQFLGPMGQHATRKLNEHYAAAALVDEMLTQALNDAQFVPTVVKWEDDEEARSGTASGYASKK